MDYGQLIVVRHDSRSPLMHTRLVLIKGKVLKLKKWWQGPILKRKPLSVDVMRSPKRKGGECKLNVEHLTFGVG